MLEFSFLEENPVGFSRAWEESANGGASATVVEFEEVDGRDATREGCAFKTTSSSSSSETTISSSLPLLTESPLLALVEDFLDLPLPLPSFDLDLDFDDDFPSVFSDFDDFDLLRGPSSSIMLRLS